MRKIFIWFFIIFSFLSSNIYSSETTKLFLNGISSYKSGNYNETIKDFSQIIESGISNGKLFYNLGNAYLKNNDLGNAILWYKRALKLIPNDPDLKFNLNYAISLVRDQKEEDISPFSRIFFFWKYLLNTVTIQWIAILSSFSFFILVSVRFILKNKILNIISLFAGFIFVIFTLTSLYIFYEEANFKKGVILKPEVSVRSGFDKGSTELFRLHAGTIITIQKSDQEFLKIYFADGKIGWIKKEEIGII
ncbi:MAG: tetratricopeptide repeat protein [Desulfobacterales bacterium]|nr:tetratricopeptide repeat protein [Desulfobacterales bacterium]